MSMVWSSMLTSGSLTRPHVLNNCLELRVPHSFIDSGSQTAERAEAQEGGEAVTLSTIRVGSSGATGLPSVLPQMSAQVILIGEGGRKRVISA